MAIKRGKVVAVTSVKGGTGKTTTVLNLAGILSNRKIKTLIIDGDFYNGGIAVSLDVPFDKDLYLLVNDMATSHFDNLETYIKPYNDFIDVLPGPKDPRDANKIESKYLHVLLSKARMKYDVILVDLNHIMDSNNLTFLDEADMVYYVMTNDLNDIKGMKTMISIYSDMDFTNYRIILNDAKDKLKQTLSRVDVKNVIKDDLDYIIPASFYLSDINNYTLKGNIVTVNKVIRRKHKKAIAVFESIVDEILDSGDNDVKEETSR